MQESNASGGQGSIIPIRLRSAEWQAIDAAMDNISQRATVELDAALARASSEIRAKGNGAFGALDRNAIVALPLEGWRFVVASLLKALRVYERVGDGESSRLSNAALVAIASHVGWSRDLIESFDTGPPNSDT